MATMRQAYLNRRMGPLLMLGIGSGLAYTLCADTLQAWMTGAGINLKTLGVAGLISFPFSFKFLWAPLMDRYAPPFLGRRRGWLLLMQMLIILCVLGMALAGAGRIWLLAAMAVMLALAGASQDVVGDAYRTDLLEEQERGAGAAVWVMGWRIGFSLSGVAVVYAVGQGWIIWEAGYILMAATMLLPMVGTLISSEPAAEAVRPRSLAETFGEPLWRFLLRREGWLVLAFVLVFKAPEFLANQMTLPFLNRGAGFSLDQIAIWRQGFGVVVMIAGTIVGGAMTARLRLRKCLWICGVLHGVSNLAFLLLINSGPNVPLLAGVVAVENFVVGLTTATFVAFLTGHCEARFSATQYALLSGVMSFSRMACAAPSGWLAEHVGWTLYFILSMLTMVPGLLLIIWVPLSWPRESQEDADVVLAVPEAATE